MRDDNRLSRKHSLSFTRTLFTRLLKNIFFTKNALFIHSANQNAPKTLDKYHF